MTSNPDEPTKKQTIYMIRHAESEENRRLGSVKNILTDLSRFTRPKAEDLQAGVEYMDVAAQIDSDVSPVGKQQIAEMAQILRDNSFLSESQIQMVAHSPLIRAKETSRGVLGCAAPDDMAPPVARVVELDLLIEKTLTEWTVGFMGFKERLGRLEQWLSEQPESRIALVGHSQFFRALLNQRFKFGNCDVWQVEFDGSQTEAVPQEAEEYSLPPKWSKMKRLYSCKGQAPSDSSSADGACL